ncbi:hypothetical protein FKM82_027387 [Ascaphus truei]
MAPCLFASLCNKAPNVVFWKCSSRISNLVTRASQLSSITHVIHALKIKIDSVKIYVYIFLYIYIFIFIYL